MRKRDTRPYTVGAAAKLRREELGLTQGGLVEKAVIHRTERSDVGRGTRKQSLVINERLAAALVMTMPKLFTVVERV